MQHRMSKVAVREGVGTDLQPDNKSVQLAKGPNARVIDEAVHHHICHNKTERCIDDVCECNPPPGGIKLVSIPLRFWTVYAHIAPLPSSNSSLRLVCGHQLNDICNEEMARDHGIEAGSEQ